MTRHLHRQILRWVSALALTVPTVGLAQGPGEHSAVLDTDCDRSCLIGLTHQYLEAMIRKDRSQAHCAPSVRLSENGVPMPLGERGLWKSSTALSSTGLELADPDSGSSAWYGTVREGTELAYLAVRIRVAHRQIIEIETLVHRKGRLPAPFGDPEKLGHDAAFQQPLAPAERRSRERLIAVANGYFSTVERNDGAVLTQFDPDCQRNENGISTTQGSFGAAADAQGCEAQFKLGLYRINKRVRERRFPLVDEERGIVLATAFFDHDNAVDTYLTNDGKSHRTALKWPNSIMLMEAFKIRNGMIYRVEVVFTYVPYFMHSPWAPGGQDTALQPRDAFTTAPPARPSEHSVGCESACLIGLADRYMSALVAHDHATLPWADRVRFEENGVSMMIGDALWATVTAACTDALRIADPHSGNVAWLGTVAEHGEPAYFAMRMQVESGRIAAVETVVTRKNTADRFGDPAAFRPDDGFAQSASGSQRLSRAKLIAIVDGYYAGAQHGPGRADRLSRIDPNCRRTENAVPAGAAACMPAATLGGGAAVAYRVRQYPLVDEDHGIVVASGYVDREPTPGESDAAASGGVDKPVPYSRSEGFIEAFKVVDGKIVRIESVATQLPYFMHSD